jgi:hypothetical protein
MSNVFAKNRFTDWNLLSFVVFILGCIALLPQFVISAQGAGTDFPYMQALNWIWSHHLPLKYGTDITYTYGPLGFLCFKVANNWQLFILILLFEIYVYINFVLILKAFMPVQSVLAALTVLFSLYFFDKQFGEATYYLIFLFSVFIFLKTNGYRYLINAALISVICFFIKVNFGLVQLFLLFMVVLYALWANKGSRLLLIAIAASSVLAIPVLGAILHVSIISYMRTSLDIISGYNETMVLPVSAALKKFQIAFLIMVVYNLIALFYLFKSGFKIENILRYLLTSLYIFIVFKYSFTRADLNKVPHAFFIFIVAAVAIQYLFEETSYQNRLRDLVLINFFMAGTFYFNSNQFLGGAEIKSGLSVEFFRDMAGGAKKKFSCSDEIKKSRLFPDSILKKIGTDMVDLMPYNLSLIFINQLNYCPRPTLQSYAAYTATLDSFNCKKYMSDYAPKFVLFTSSSVDNRDPFWDESATKRAVCQNYQVVDSFFVDDSYNSGYKTTERWLQKYLLLQRRTVPLQATVKAQSPGELTLNENFNVDTGSAPQYLYANFEYTLAGKIKGLLFQPSIVYVVFTYENGKTDSVKALLPIMKSGVLINKKIITTEDAETLFRTNGAGNDKVKWIKFVPADNFSFKRKAKYHTELISYSSN